MKCQNDQNEDIYVLLAQSIEINESTFQILSQILQREKIQDSLEFLSSCQNQRKVELEILQEQRLNVEKNDVKKITNFLCHIKDHEFNKVNYSKKEYKKVKENLITNISNNKKIIELLKFLVHLTAVDQQYIQCGSNSLHLLVEMKAELNTQSFENIKIKNTSLQGANFIRCNFSGSEFDNVCISGINISEAKLFNCKWKNISINEEIKLNGHRNCVNSVCFSPDGNSLASSSDDNFILWWDLKTGKIKSAFQRQREVKQVCFSPNGDTLASCNGKFIYLWNYKTGKQISKLIRHVSDIQSVCFSPDGTTLGSGSQDMSIRLWDVKIRQQKAKLDGYRDSVQSVCFSSDGNTIASCSLDMYICLWDFKTGYQKSKLRGHEDGVNTVCFSSDGTTLASGSRD
ncbi:unnamed protein product [Paramecium octaurelia]|uniref:WD-40 repeat protein n=1 Tax=Paramecium octaurelia TaxID=43137 RepID=A0A8S1SHG8_PAROT|nr:unnamed protein product [Paramecium octaurelia]